MSAPVLNHRLLLEAPERIADGAGGWSTAWVTLGTVWGEIRAQSGREAGGDVGAVSRARYRITVRAAPVGQTGRPVAGQRFRQGPRIWSIEAVAEADGAARYLTCFAQEERAT